MKIKCVSFSKYNANLKSYVFQKLDLFEFLFAQIILNDKLDENIKFSDCLLDLDIKEDLFYLFNNTYYKFKDNHVIECLKEDLSFVYLKDIKVNSLFVEPLKKGLFPLFKDTVNKEFCYDYLNKKIVSYKEEYDDSNVMCFRVNNTCLEIERLVNRFIPSLFNHSEGVYLLDSVIVDPYYFDVELTKENDKWIYKRSYKEELYQSLIDNSLYVNDTHLEGEYLSSNIYFTYIFTNKDFKDNCKYRFVYNDSKEGEIDGNIVYVNYKFDDYDLVDLVNKKGYECGYCLLENNKKISTFVTHKENKVGDFKLYLIKNKNKFKMNINEVIDAI